ncbi:3-deoxy-D-manno-octulosonic acid transferase [Salinimicrobium flavum]|uniref:3-deoxy-D-manno-octulosonic acid transferase n=1 Tax=Salinimicrobium flavum TaxID=1737065 RepID=A0ABW5ITX1_9FLAO
MRILYNLVVNTAEKVLPVSGLFSEKMKLFTEGRKQVFTQLEEKIGSKDRTVWIHAASLGEYEQAVPVIEAIRKVMPKHKIVITFFSPSGYEVKKNSALADVVTYLPLDTSKNAKKFLQKVHPDLALFIKYEFWPNFLKQLNDQNIPTLLISGAFRKEQLFFRSYGGFMRAYLKTFDHFFVQNEPSEQLLNSIGFVNVTISGDTRFDRVSLQLQRDNHLDFVDRFSKDHLCVVAGSTWPEDEDLLIPFINKAPQNVKFIIAPHAIRPARIDRMQQQLEKASVLYTEMEGEDLGKFQVLIIDTVGLLTKIYSYADIAYVGGAAGNTGLHNILEPATFGAPVVIGKNFSRFPEAIRLQQLAGLFSVRDEKELEEVFNRLLSNENFRRQTGMIAEHYINSNTGATNKIIDYLLTHYSKVT